MKPVRDLFNAEQRVVIEACDLLVHIRERCSVAVGSPSEALAVISDVRDLAYESLNQLQHEYLILLAVKYLIEVRSFPEDTIWYWNPRSTGGIDEPDLKGLVDGNVVVSAEVTTSRRPVGTIDVRMRATLSKLSGFEGEKFYFVRTTAMARRAATIITKSGYEISEILLPGASDDL